MLEPDHSYACYLFLYPILNIYIPGVGVHVQAVVPYSSFVHIGRSYSTLLSACFGTRNAVQGLFRAELGLELDKLYCIATFIIRVAGKAAGRKGRCTGSPSDLLVCSTGLVLCSSTADFY